MCLFNFSIPSQPVVYSTVTGRLTLRHQEAHLLVRVLMQLARHL